MAFSLKKDVKGKLYAIYKCAVYMGLWNTSLDDF